MKIKIFLFNLYILIFLKLNIFNSILVLPIETLSKDNYLTGNYSAHQKIVRESLLKTLYTIFEIGTPVQKIPLFINTRELEFEITSLSINNGNLLEYNLIYNLSSIFNKYDFYKEQQSSTFKTEGCINNHNIFSDHLLDCFSNDTIYFYQDKKMEKLVKFENINFNLVKQKEENITGFLGLGLFENDLDKIEKSFMKIIKRKNIIKDYNWYFQFNSWNNPNGKLIIGSLPHEDYPDIYSEEDLLYTFIPQDYSIKTKSIKIEFDDIYTNGTNSTLNIKLFSTNAYFTFDSDITIGPKEFETKIKEKFLDNFLYNKKCFEESFKQTKNYINQFKFYYCDISLKETLYDILPTINFVSKELNFIFELTKDEIYKIKGNYIYFLVLFDNGRQNNWILSRPITLKYPFVFNPASNKVGFYQKFKTKINSESDNGRKKNYFKKSLMIFIVIILSIFLVILGIIIGKILYGFHRKKRANELIDTYEYISDNNLNKDINQNNKSNINNKTYITDEKPSIEMTINYV